MDFNILHHAQLSYLDGGTGSMLLQAAIAGLLGAAYMAKTRWIQLKTIVGAKFSQARQKKDSSSVG